jgi:hypothetical protein
MKVISTLPYGMAQQPQVVLVVALFRLEFYFYVLEFNDGIKEAVQGRVYLSR